jgi:hypothetical protein
LMYCYDIGMPLTPNNLIFGKRLGKNEINKDETEQIEESVKSLDTILDHFWKRWSREYLLEIRDTQRKKKTSGGDTVKIGDVVLVEDDKLKRQKWRIGRIDELFISKDGVIRGAGLTTKTKDGTGRLRRPLNKLYPFEKANESQAEEKDSDLLSLTFVPDNINIVSVHP